MAFTASASKSTPRASMLECSLCLSTYKKPKCLPCLHTFCLDCLQEYVDKTDFTDQLPCPLCREMFSIPPEGLTSLRDNFFIQSMVEQDGMVGTMVEVKADIEEVKCDVCRDNSEVLHCPGASRYCAECDESMCITCSSSHVRMRGSNKHSTVPLNEKDGPVEAATLHRIRYCEKHQDDSLRLYCIKCEMAVCMICLATNHKGHDCEEIAETSDKYRAQFDTKILELERASKEFGIRIQNLKEMEDGVRKDSQKNDSDIRKSCNEMRRELDLYEGELFDANKKLSGEVTKGIKTERSVAEFHNTQVDNLKEYLQKIKEAGSHCDVACSGQELLTRTDHVMRTSNKVLLKERAAVRHVKFIQYTGREFTKEMIGKLIMGALGGRIQLTLGLTTGSSTEQKICEISLEKQDTINVTNSTPAKIWPGSAACVVNNVLYAVGIGGGARDEMWAWSASRDEWMRCADMTSGRSRHCVTSVDDKIYVLGGWVDAGKKTLDSILCYDINSNKWSEAGKLCHAVYGAACVTYKHYVYLFGGAEKDSENVNHVQIYDTTTCNVSLASNPMPAAYYLMRAVLWRSKVLLMGHYTCYIYDFESSTWQERKRFKTDVVHFSLTLDDNTFYITGGGTKSDDMWTCRADVKSLLVDDFISDNEKAEWKHHATLPTPGLISAYSPVSIIKAI